MCLLNTSRTVLRRYPPHAAQEGWQERLFLDHSVTAFQVDGRGEGVAGWKRNKKSRLDLSLHESAGVWEHRDEELLNVRQTQYLLPSFYFQFFWKIITKISPFWWPVQPSALCVLLLEWMVLPLWRRWKRRNRSKMLPWHRERGGTQNTALMGASLPQSAWKQGSGRAPGSTCCCSLYFVNKNKFTAI